MSLKPTWLVQSLGTAVAVLAVAAAAHTLPVSYLRLATDADYLHLELIFNPFELTFLAEVDDNRDAELGPAELQRHGQKLAERLVGAFQMSVGGKPLQPETAGMDPDLSGHHVRVRAHYKVDARQLPLTLESDLIEVTSASHLVQVTCVNGAVRQLAQLDSQSRKVTFEPLPEKQPPLVAVASREPAAFGWLPRLLAVIVILVIVVAFLLFGRKRMD